MYNANLLFSIVDIEFDGYLQQATGAEIRERLSSISNCLKVNHFHALFCYECVSFKLVTLL